MTIADYIFAACMTVVIVWIVAEGDRRGPFQKFGRDKIKNYCRHYLFTRLLLTADRYCARSRHRCGRRRSKVSFLQIIKHPVVTKTLTIFLLCVQTQ
jgi:hypothetical protein